MAQKSHTSALNLMPDMQTCCLAAKELLSVTRSMALITLLIRFFFFLTRCSDLVRQTFSLARDQPCDMRADTHTHQKIKS